MYTMVISLMQQVSHGENLSSPHDATFLLMLRHQWASSVVAVPSIGPCQSWAANHSAEHRMLQMVIILMGVTKLFLLINCLSWNGFKFRKLLIFHSCLSISERILLWWLDGLASEDPIEFLEAPCWRQSTRPQEIDVQMLNPRAEGCSDKASVHATSRVLSNVSAVVYATDIGYIIYRWSNSHHQLWKNDCFFP